MEKRSNPPDCSALDPYEKILVLALCKYKKSGDISQRLPKRMNKNISDNEESTPQK